MPPRCPSLSADRSCGEMRQQLQHDRLIQIQSKSAEEHAHEAAIPLAYQLGVHDTK